MAAGTRVALRRPISVGLGKGKVMFVSGKLRHAVMIMTLVRAADMGCR